MRPILLSLGSWEVRSYNVFLCLAIVLALALFLRVGRRAGYRRTDLVFLAAGGVAVGLLGGRSNAWVFQLSGAIPGVGPGLASLRGGFVSFGGILGALVFAGLYARTRGWSVLALLDLAVPFLPLAEAVFRWGCLFNGCCYGRRTEGFLGFYLPDSTGFWAHRYPTQVLLSLFGLALFVWLWRRRGAPEGQQILLYLMVYPLGRAAVGFLRGDQRLVVGFLGFGQLAAIAIVGLAAVAWNHLESTRSSG